jgi:SSS family solute:Na+ symporter
MHIIDYTIVGVYLLSIVLVGLYLKGKASSGIDSYFLGNRNIPWWALGASGMASNTDIAGTMIGVALVYAMGTAGFFIEIRGGVVLVLAFFMIFMGKWTRRSQVMTSAEWMRYRFGKGKQGDMARLLSAIANILFTIAMVSYFAIGSGKFAGEFLGIDWRLAALLMAGLAMIYTVASGLYGVVWTDVFQGVLIFGAIIFVCIKAVSLVTLPEVFSTSVPLADGTFQTIQVKLSDWSRITPPTTMDLPGVYSMYNLFGLAITFYLFKIVLEGSSGGNGYMVQRYLSSKSDREAGLLSLLWTILLTFRWPLIISFAMLGIHYGMNNTVIADPELVLPTVLQHYLPIGIKGVLIAAFMAAAMSTFDSTVNAGAAFWVKDLYQAFINPSASEKKLMMHSRVGSIGIVVLGLLFSFSVSNINDIWGWISMGMSAGLFVPQILRWYWARFNGYGYAIGTFTGIAVAVLLRLIGGEIPEYLFFLIASGSSLLGCIIGTFLTEETERSVLENFYRTTRPFGLWGNIKDIFPTAIKEQINKENRRDIISTVIAMVWQLSLFLSGMMLILGHWGKLGLLLGVFAFTSVLLYFNWYKHLSNEVEIKN